MRRNSAYMSQVHATAVQNAVLVHESKGHSRWASIRGAVTGSRNGDKEKVAQQPRKGSISLVQLDSVYIEHKAMAKRLHMLMPDDIYLLNWDRWVMLTLLWSAVSVPMHVSIWLDQPANWGVFSLDWIVSASLICDIAIVSRTAVYKKDDTFVVEPAAVRHRYLRTWLLLDCACAFPYQVRHEHLGGRLAISLLAILFQQGH